jgi:hypothetical protein
MSARRYAILDDNQRELETRLAMLRQTLPGLIAARACAAMVIGSVAEGRAGDASDIDVVVVLREGVPARADYRWWDGEVAPRLAAARFPVQPLVIGRASLGTAEPHLRRALDGGIPLWDPEGCFDDERAARA